MAKAGLQSIYLSGWQVAADSNMAGQTYPDQSLYPANSAAKLVERINNAFIRADQIAHMEESDKHIDFFLPIVADCEAGFGGPLNAFEITKAMVRLYFSSRYFVNFQALWNQFLRTIRLSKKARTDYTDWHSSLDSPLEVSLPRLKQEAHKLSLFTNWDI